MHSNNLQMGRYGPGIYTYTNPALAHRATAPIRHENAENRAIIQCRVVTREYIGAGETFSYAVDTNIPQSFKLLSLSFAAHRVLWMNLEWSSALRLQLSSPLI